MPTYEYLCSNCGRFEEFQGINDPPLKHCPKCGGPVSRLISPGLGIMFKGSGFYLTDYDGATSQWGVGTKDSKGSSSTGTRTASSKTEKKAGKGGRSAAAAAGDGS